jgi:hypothetical protein
MVIMLITMEILVVITILIVMTTTMMIQMNKVIYFEKGSLIVINWFYAQQVPSHYIINYNTYIYKELCMVALYYNTCIYKEPCVDS